MNTLRSPGDIRLLLLCLAVFALSACGQRDEATTEPADEVAAAEMARPDKVPVTT